MPSCTNFARGCICAAQTVPPAGFETAAANLDLYPTSIPVPPELLTVAEVAARTVGGAHGCRDSWPSAR